MNINDSVDNLDINECYEETHNCLLEENRKCSNTIGQFDCVCSDGYMENDAGVCTGG